MLLQDDRKRHRPNAKVPSKYIAREGKTCSDRRKWPLHPIEPGFAFSCSGGSIEQEFPFATSDASYLSQISMTRKYRSSQQQTPFERGTRQSTAQRRRSPPLCARMPCIDGRNLSSATAVASPPKSTRPGYRNGLHRRACNTTVAKGTRVDRCTAIIGTIAYSSFATTACPGVVVNSD